MKLNKIVMLLIFISFTLLVGGIGYELVFKNTNKISAHQDCTPINFRKEKKASDYFLLWDTKEECSGIVKFGTSLEDFPYLGVDVSATVKTREHEVKLGGIEENSTYHFIIISDGKIYGVNGLPISITF